MKKLTKQAIAITLAILMLAGLATPALAARHPFTDVRDGRWYSEAVQFVYEHNIMGGVGNNRFDPQGNLTRAQVTALLFRVHNERTANAPDSRSNNFNDVNNEWFAPYVTWAFNNNIVTGTSSTTFNPHGNISRQEFATMVYRYAMEMTVMHDRNMIIGQQAAPWTQFADRGQIATWAYPALRWMSFRSIVIGSTATTINPTGTATRAEAAVMVMRFVEQIPPPHFPAIRSDSIRTGTPVPFAAGADRVLGGDPYPFFISIANSLSQLRAIYINDTSPSHQGNETDYTDDFFNDSVIVAITLRESAGFGHDIELVRNGDVLGVNIRRFTLGGGSLPVMWGQRFLLEVNREDIAGITAIEYFRH